MASLRLPVTGAAASVASVLVIVLALGGAWWAAALKPDARPALTSALDALPASTTVVGFTDWAKIRERHTIGVAARRDLTTRSVIATSVDEMDDLLGWSPADAEWEVYGQGRDGTAAVVRLGQSVAFDDVRSKLRAAGYRQDGQRWTASRRNNLTEIFINVSLVPRQRLVVLSDRAASLPPVLDVIDGRAGSLAGNAAAADTARALAGSDSVLLQGGTLGCRSTAVTGADREQQARAAVDRAGELDPYRFSGRAVTDNGGAGFSAQQVVFALTFDSAAQASEQVQVRAKLAAGPFIGRNGPIEETLRLRSSAADESTARLSFAHDPDTDVFMTGTGPVLFASC